MHIFQLAFLSLKRKPTKGIVIFSVLFMLFSLIFTGIIIQNTITASKDYTRKALGGNVEMKVDFAKAMQDIQGASGETRTEIENQMVLPENMAKVLSEDPAVSKTHIERTLYTSSNTLQSAVSNDDSSFGTSIAMPSDGGTSLFLLASNQNIPLDFDKQLKLVEGTFRTDGDREKDTVLVSSEFAAKNNLSFGDAIEVKLFPEGEPVSFEIIGLFSGAPNHMVDQLYISEASVERHAPEQLENISRVVWQLKDPFDIPDFLASYSEQMPSEYIYLDASTEKFNQLTKPLDVMSTVFDILMVVIFIAGAMISIAIVTLFVRDRQFEIGLLLANGESKARILSQFSVEIFFVAAFAFAGAFALSLLSSDLVAGWIAANQLVESTSPSQGIFFIDDMMSGPQLTMSQVAESFKVSIDKDTLLALAVASLGLILAAISAPLSVILSYKPRKSLQN